MHIAARRIPHPNPRPASGAREEPAAKPWVGEGRRAGVCMRSEYFMWRRQLRDPANEPVLEAAVNGPAAATVTFNRRDFGAAPARFGIELLTPADAIRRIRT
jgi:hypothetical protein